MALATAVQAARHTPQVITWQDVDGNPLNLTGATLTGRIQSEATGAARAVDGTLTVTDAVGGVFTWTYGAVDVGTAGAFRVQFIAAFVAGGNDKTFQEDWRVEAAL